MNPSRTLLVIWQSKTKHFRSLLNWICPNAATRMSDEINMEDGSNKIEAEAASASTSTAETITLEDNFSARNLRKRGSMDKLMAKERKGGGVDFSRFARRKVAMMVLYCGWNYSGLAEQPDATTIEGVLKKALVECQLVPTIDQCRIDKCGRTDKEVSGFQQVLATDLRCNVTEGTGVFWPQTDDSIDAQSPIQKSPLNDIEKSKRQNEYDYPRMINSRLPKDIRVLAWAPVERDFSARYHCTGRSYRYFFPRGRLDLQAMQTACQALVGEHDFRNFCRLDLNAARLESSLVRRIDRCDIIFNEHRDVGDLNSLPSEAVCALAVDGSGFLWHQIRCIVSVLFFVGSGIEPPTVVAELLDVCKHPRKPNYPMAVGSPLCFFAASYVGHDFELEWSFDRDTLQMTLQMLQKMWLESLIKTSILATMVTGIEGMMGEGEKAPTDYAGILLGMRMQSPKAKGKPIKSLLDFDKSETVEEKREKLNAKRKRKLEETESQNADVETTSII